jgi:glycine/D-amino acid oxidase-like deaminating enzyme
MAPRVNPVASDEALSRPHRRRHRRWRHYRHLHGVFLARKGVPVTLCEKGHIAGEQSSRNWGWCRKMGRDPREIPLAIEALRLWGEMNDAVQAETGYRRCGIVYLCKTQADLEKKPRGWRRRSPISWIRGC